MNSIQLAQRLARNLTVEDPFNLPADAALDVLSAINAGLTSFYREMPGIYKRTVLSQLVRAPKTLKVTYLRRFDHFVQDNTFTSDMIGCTLRFGTKDADTVITGPNTVLDDWRSENLGPLDATVYFDTIPIQDVIERIIGSIRCYDNSQSQPTILIRDERLRGGRAMWWNWPWDQWGDSWFPLDGWLFGSVGRPRYYYLEAAGVSQGAEPEMYLRLVPFPDIDYTIRLEAELYTQRIRFADLTTARSILVGDAYIDDILIPLCEAELITSPFWRDKETIPTITARQQNVLATKLPKVPADVAPPMNLIGTPRGY